MKTHLAAIKSPSIGPCECCGDPVYDPAHELARHIFETLPLEALPKAEAQKFYDALVSDIEATFNDVIDLFINADEAPRDGAAVH